MNRCAQTMNHATVLLAEDDPDLRELLAFCLFSQGYAVESFSQGLGLLERLQDHFDGRREPVDLIISDLRMPGLTGLEVLESLCDRPDRPPVICITAFGDPATHRQARRLGAAEVLDKPFDIDILLDRARRLCPPSGAYSKPRRES